MRAVLSVIAVIALCACQAKTGNERYADCILGHMKGSMSQAAVDDVREACYAKFRPDASYFDHQLAPAAGNPFEPKKP